MATGCPICLEVKSGFSERLRSRVMDDYKIWSPVLGADGLWRLQCRDSLDNQPSAHLTLVPLKKLLLPSSESVWSWNGQAFKQPEPPPVSAVFGVPLCDLQAIWCLDRAFSDDSLYQLRRESLLIIGSPCQPSKSCRCSFEDIPLAGDLFWSDERVWVLSEKGKMIMNDLEPFQREIVDCPIPVPEVEACSKTQVDESLFDLSAQSSVWHDEGQKCLSCGACSAVCPTCYCYDMIDTVDLDGGVTRHRTWDNCFFADHAQVAGGHDFRPDRASRLRFRFEHKKLGFGALRGTPSCVGCGRCLEACPVGIDLDQIADRLLTEFLSC